MRKVIRVSLGIIAIILTSHQAHCAPEYNKQLPQGLVYQLEVGPVGFVVLADWAAKYKVYSTTNFLGGNMKHYLGAFRNHEEIKEQQKEMVENGIIAEIVAYFNKRKITIDDALLLENNKNREDQQQLVLQEHNKKQLQQAIAGGMLYYTVCIASTELRLTKDFYQNIDGAFELTTMNGKYNYLVGKHQASYEAEYTLEQMLRLGKKEAYVCAFFNGELITRFKADEIAALLTKEEKQVAMK